MSKKTHHFRPAQGGVINRSHGTPTKMGTICQCGCGYHLCAYAPKDWHTFKTRKEGLAFLATRGWLPGDRVQVSATALRRKIHNGELCLPRLANDKAGRIAHINICSRGYLIVTDSSDPSNLDGSYIDLADLTPPGN